MLFESLIMLFIAHKFFSLLDGSKFVTIHSIMKSTIRPHVSGQSASTLPARLSLSIRKLKGIEY